MKDDISVSTRLRSMFVDHFFMCLILVPPAIFVNNTFGDPTSFVRNEFESISFWVLMLIYFNKDAFGAQSLSKRLFGLVVVDNSIQVKASPLKCFVRNLFIPIWPFEVLISAFSQSRRLGDFLAGTSLVKTNQIKLDTTSTNKSSPKLSIQVLLILCIWLIHSFILNALLNLLIPF